MVSNFASIPDMKFEIREVLVAGDGVIVRGEVTGTPSGRIVRRAAPRQQLPNHGRRHPDHRDGKIANTCHMENWLSAIGQLRAK